MFRVTMAEVASGFYNTPIALDTTRAGNIAATLRLMGAEMLPDTECHGQPYEVVDNIAVIEIGGTLLHRFGPYKAGWGLTGYDGVRVALQRALDDRTVRGIVLDIDSPGGEVAGCVDLADEIFAARARKPLLAILTKSALSGAYLLASAAHRIAVPRTGSVGGVGIIALVADMSGALTMKGITVNVIQFGARKADGLEVLPMSPAARARFQADVDTIGNLFVKTVARNRGLNPAAVLALQGANFLGPAGVRRGLADVVAPPQDVFERFATNLISSTPPRRSAQRSIRHGRR